MRVRALLMVVALLVVPAAATAQQTPKLYRIGVLANALDTADGPLFRIFLDTLKSLGYVEERSITIDWRSSEGEDSQLPTLASELVRSKVDVIFATSLRPARAAVEVTRSVPIVFVVSGDPIGQRLVPNLSRPGGNVTGLCVYHPRETSEKVMQFFRALVPKLSLLAVLTNPTNPVQRDLMADALPSAAQRAKISLLPLQITSAADLQPAFEQAAQRRAEAVYVLSDVLTYINRARIVELAARYRLPAIYGIRGAVEEGGLMSYGPDLREPFRSAAIYVDKILKGARPGDMRVESSTKYDLVVSMKTAKTLGIVMPSWLLRQADHVIE